jgi:hypothetical protein
MSKLVSEISWDVDTLTDLNLFVPGVTASVLDQNVKTTLDPFLPGADLKEQKATYDTFSLEEKKKVLDQIVKRHKDDPLHALIVTSYLNDLTSWDIWLENAGGVLDAATLGLLAISKVTALAKGAKIAASLRQGNVATTGVSVGNRETALTQTVDVAEAIKKGDIPYDSKVAKETATLMLEGQSVPLNDMVGVGISGKLREHLLEVNNASKAFLNSPRVKLLDPTERNVMLRTMQEDLANNLIDSGMRHVDLMRVAPIQPPPKEDMFGTVYTVVYGNAKGAGYATETQAINAAKRLKLDNYTVAPMEMNGAYYVSISKRASNESGFINPVQTTGREGFGKRLGFLSRHTLSKSSLVDFKAQKLGHLTASSREALMAAGKRLEKVKALVKGADKEFLEKVIELGTREHDGVWYSIETLRQRFGLNDKQIAAYQAFKTEEDLADIVLNAAEYINLNSKGYLTVKLNKPLENLTEFAAKPVQFSDISKPSTKSFWDVSKRKHVEFTETEKFTELEKQGYKIYELRGARETEAEVPVQFLLLKETDATIHPLNLRQIHYRPGGRIQYEDKYFLKMGRMRQGPGKTKIAFRAKTFGVGSQENTNKAKEIFEKAREAYLSKSPTRDEDIAEITGGRFANAQVFEDFVGKKNLQHNLPFEVVKDGERLPSIDKAIADGAASALVEDINEMNTIQRMIAMEGSFKSKRGERLPMFNENNLLDFDVGKPAPIVSPFETSAATLTRAINVASINTFRTRQMEAWYTTFKHTLDLAAHPKRTALGWLTESNDVKYKKLTGTAEEKSQLAKSIEQAKAMEMHIKNVIGTETTYDINRRRALEAAIAKSMPTLKKFGVGENMLDKIAQADPVRLLRTIVYHKTMGLFNTKQPATQLQATALMATIDPVNGVEAGLTTPILGMLLLSENSKTIETIVKAASKMIPGSLPERIQEGLEVLKRTENWRMNSRVLPEQEYLHLSAPTLMRKVLEYGEQPFLVSERYNKIASTYAAYLNWRKSNPNVKVITDEDILDIRTRGEVMVASMGKVDQADIQQGMLGLLTQFWGYPLRFLEMIAPIRAGGNRHLTGKEKWQIALGQLAMHGIGGTVGIGPGRHFREVINQEWMERFGQQPDETFVDILETGFLSGILLTALLNADEVDYYQKGFNFVETGPGKIISRLIEGDFDKLISIDSAGLSALTDLGGSLKDVAQAIFAITPLDPTVTYDDALTGLSEASKNLFVKNISSLKQGQRTLWALQHQKFMTSSGEVLRDDVTTGQAIADLFGISSSGEARLYAMQQLSRYHSANEQETVKALAQQLRLFLNSERSEKNKKSWGSMRSIYLSRHPENRHEALIKSAWNRVTKDSKQKVKQQLFKHYMPQSIGEN